MKMYKKILMHFVRNLESHYTALEMVCLICICLAHNLPSVSSGSFKVRSWGSCPNWSCLNMVLGKLVNHAFILVSGQDLASSGQIPTFLLDSIPKSWSCHWFSLGLMSPYIKWSWKYLLISVWCYMVNLLFIKSITLWQILPRDLLGIGQHEPLMRTGCPSRAHGSYRISPWQNERSVCQVTPVQRPGGWQSLYVRPLPQFCSSHITQIKDMPSTVVTTHTHEVTAGDSVISTQLS